MRLTLSSAAAVALLAAAQPAICANPPLAVTIEATQEALRHKVHDFVAAAVVQPIGQESLLRWNRPICPLVVGLPKEWGELILARISQAARDAHAPLAGEHCEPNLFVVVSPQPDEVLKQWMANKPKVDTPHGLEPLKQFLHSTRPIRVWYDSEPGCEGGVSQPQSAGQLSALGLPTGALSKYVSAGPPGGMGPTFCNNRMDTHLTYGDIRSIGYAIVVADSNKLHENHVTLGQLGDYAALVGLANIQPDADGGGEPTMLRLFHDPKPPTELTQWDRALLYSLYNTNQSGKLQLTDMEVSMARRMTTQTAQRSTP